MSREDAVERDGLGLSYIPFGENYHFGYSGWDEVQRYATRWPSEVKRDLRHDIDAYKPGNAEYFSKKSKFFRGWHPWQVFALITSFGSSEATHRREDWSLSHFRFPPQKGPVSRDLDPSTRGGARRSGIAGKRQWNSASETASDSITT